MVLSAALPEGHGDPHLGGTASLAAKGTTDTALSRLKEHFHCVPPRRSRKAPTEPANRGQTREPRRHPRPPRSSHEQDNIRAHFRGDTSVGNQVYVFISVLFTMCFDSILHNSHVSQE